MKKLLLISTLVFQFYFALATDSTMVAEKNNVKKVAHYVFGHIGTSTFFSENAISNEILSFHYNVGYEACIKNKWVITYRFKYFEMFQIILFPGGNTLKPETKLTINEFLFGKKIKLFKGEWTALGGIGFAKYTNRGKQIEWDFRDPNRPSDYYNYYENIKSYAIHFPFCLRWSYSLSKKERFYLLAELNANLNFANKNQVLSGNYGFSYRLR